MDYYKIMDSIIDIFQVEGYATIADDLSSIIQNSFSATEILMAFTFKVKEILKQNSGLNPELYILSNNLVEFCYSIGLVVI